MRVSTYAKNNAISLQDVFESLTTNFGGNWTSTSKLTDQHIDYLNNVFTLTQPALPPSTEQPPLPQPQEAIVPKQPSGLDLSSLQAKLSPQELAVVQRLVDVENITTSAQIEAIDHHNLYEDIYSSTRRALGTRKLTSSLAERERLQNLHNERVAARKTTLEGQLEEHEQTINSVKTWLDNFKLQNQIEI